MPRISFFYGITIRMYWDERDHPIPHFHAEYASNRASVTVDGALIAGKLPRRQLRLVREWTRLHRAELLDNWYRARREEPLARIHPLA